MGISRQLVPPGGWKYLENETWLYGKTFDELLTNLIEHRVSNKIELCNPEKDIEDQLVKNFPIIAVNPFKCIVK